MDRLDKVLEQIDKLIEEQQQAFDNAVEAEQYADVYELPQMHEATYWRQCELVNTRLMKERILSLCN